ncbi:MAG TPA: polysaccharide biosynthesis/export family protein [Terriglobales bacterium]|jgi:polysaccharide export outer membrane protein|nr:polysaccharide biosynthesis/export family protein [Terriglobales bacterium]
MYFEGKTVGKKIFILTAIVLLGLWTMAAYAQDNAASQDNSAQAGTDSTTAAKPVIPAASDSGAKESAKATPLPATDTPATRVTAVKPDTYVIGVGDGLGINVWKEPELSKQVPVRPDGMITLPLIGEVKAAGLTPNQLQEQIAAALGKVMSDPQVVVMVEAVNSLSFNIMGNVYKPGYYPLGRPITVLDAIGLSGGFKDFAKQKKIYILRTDASGKQQKLHFNYKEVIKGRNMAQNIIIEPRDIIVVP